MASKAATPDDLGTKRISRLLVQYSVPAIIASVATSLYNIIDSIFIGRGVGPMAIAGLAVTFPLMNLVAAFCMLIAAGGAALSSIFLGQRNLDRANDTLNSVMVLCVVNSLVLGGFTLAWLDPILRLFGATDATLPYAREFMEVILWGTPVSYVFIGLNNVMRATGYPRKAMISALISVVVNIVLCPLMIYKWGWGIRGAAWATLSGQAVAFGWVLWHFCSRSSFIHFRHERHWFLWPLVKRIYGIGLAPFLMNVCACVVVVFINHALLRYGAGDGNLEVGAYGILNRTTMFFVMIVFGVTQGMQPILGFNYGAGKINRVKRTLRMGIWIGVAVTAVGWAITEGFPTAVSSLFTIDPELIAISDRAMRIYFVVYPVVGCQIVIQNFYQSIGHPWFSIFLSLTRQLLFLLPFLFLLPLWWGIDGVWASMCGSDIIACLVALGVLWWTLRSRRCTIFALGAPQPPSER